ncbi:MAG: hypothetical protein SFZ23_11825 [Planctomycetota bacterium]|nr:hypothetical protein [Planctomycetota bacterium]
MIDLNALSAVLPSRLSSSLSSSFSSGLSSVGLRDFNPMPMLADSSDVAIVVPTVFMISIAVTTGIIVSSINRRKVAETRAREETRREVAAYVAEGSISPDDAVRLLEAGQNLVTESSCGWDGEGKYVEVSVTRPARGRDRQNAPGQAVPSA